MEIPTSLFSPILATDVNKPVFWDNLQGSSIGLALSNAAEKYSGLIVVITADMPSADQLAHEIAFYNTNSNDIPILIFPDRETLPYDVFSPHQDIISERLGTLARLQNLKQGILIVPVATLMGRLPPGEYLAANSFFFNPGDRCDFDQLRLKLSKGGYSHVSQVMEHGEFTIRGSLIDLYPMGSSLPFRIDLFDNEIDSIRTFDPETQRTIEEVSTIRLMPAREYPLSDEGITLFRQSFHERFSVSPQDCVIYRDVSQGIAPAGIESYLPLFFERTSTLFDYLPESTLLLLDKNTDTATENYWREIEERYEDHRHDIERPLLPPEDIFIPINMLQNLIRQYPQCIVLYQQDVTEDTYHFASKNIPKLVLPPRAQHRLTPLLDFIKKFSGRILLVAETTGRRENLLEMLHECDLFPATFPDWLSFFNSDALLGMTVARLDRSLLIDDPTIAVITEAQLFGEQAMQRRRRKKRTRDADAIVQNLTELAMGAPVVHEEHGVGRYSGLQTLEAGGIKTEYIKIEYADGDKLYVPVASLHLISRYTGASAENAPLHKLGSHLWQRAKKKAAERIHDVAVELLDIYAKRQARTGRSFPQPDDQYAAFVANFPFEETPDQSEAINDVIMDMNTSKPMDRLVCGDVGFGKTEVAMRAAFLAIQGNSQIAVLVPTTLLAQQHYQTFRDRFSDLPVRIEVLSRFRTSKQQEETLSALESGLVDIIIGTHKLIQPDVKFKQLGLVIIDEEHRFGVRQKEKFKALRAEVDVLTLTATPIPRTLNMSLSGIRDLSIIATPPLKRLAVKTFIREWNKSLIREACLREIRRGGQIYFLHNEVRTIEKYGAQLREIVPEAEIRIAHGQLAERELEQIMLDFYHQRFNILLCTTIIESGIDVPNANTIIINRADKLGLAQLYQLRGRVGRSHHQAYAYLIRPAVKSMTRDAVKRLEALESIEDLGAGFMLASHDLEIRGAGEFLGEEQSGQIQEIGFTMYTEMLERAVKSLKSGQQPDLEKPLSIATEIDLGIVALIPENYLPDIHSRLVMYKRIANAKSREELDELQVEMIDRFGLLPDATKNLFKITELKLDVFSIGIRKIEAGKSEARIIFDETPNIDIDRLISLIQTQPKIYKFDGKNKLRLSLKSSEINAVCNTLVETLNKIGYQPSSVEATVSQ